MAQSSAPLEGSSSDEPPEEYPSTEEGNRKSVSDEGSSSPEFNFASTDFQLQLQRTVFVANLSLSTRPHHLLEFFKDAGTVFCYCFHYNKQNGMFLRQCLVELDTVEATDKAIKLDGKNLLGRPVKIELASHKLQQVYWRTVYVTGFTVEEKVEDYLKDVFKHYGNILEVNFPGNSQSGHCRIALITFDNRASKRKALGFNGQTYRGCSLTVKSLKPLPFASDNSRICTLVDTGPVLSLYCCLMMRPKRDEDSVK